MPHAITPWRCARRALTASALHELCKRCTTRRLDVCGPPGGTSAAPSRGMPRFHLVAAFLVVLLGCSSEDAAVSGAAAGSGGSSSASSSSSSSGAQGGAPPAGGCFAPGELPPSVAPAGFRIPSLDDERAAYMRWGWTWDP